MRIQRLFLALFILGVTGASALVSPFGIVRAQTSTPTPVTAHTLVLTGDDLKRVTTPYIFVDTWGIGLDNGCGVPTWYPGSSGVSPPGWTNSPSGCRSGNNFGPGDNIPVATVRFDFLPPPWMSDIVVETWEQPITTDSYHPPVGGYALTTTGAIDEGNNHFYPVHTSISGVTTQFDGLFYGAGQIVVYEMHVSYNDPGDHNCDNGSCLTAPPPDTTTTTDPPLTNTGGGPGMACTVCIYSPSGNLITDAPRLIQYLDCYLGNLYFCWLNQTLALIFRYILYIVLLIQSMIIWFIRQGDAIAQWTISLLMTCIFWIGGLLQNLTNEIVAVQYNSSRTTVISGGSTNLFDALIAFANVYSSAIHDLTTGISSIVASLSGVLSTLVVQIGETIRTALNDTFGVILALINAILIIVVVIIQVIGVVILAIIGLLVVVVQQLGAIVLAIIGGILGGFNTSVSNPLSGISALAPSGTSSISSVTGMCSNNVVIHLCIGAYILDNTIFGPGSPITFGFFILEGAIWMYQLVWAVAKFGKIAK
jgi:hypothetical protein